MSESNNNEFNEYINRMKIKDEEKKRKQRERSKKYYEDNKEKIKWKNRIYQIKKLKETDEPAFNRYFDWLANKKKSVYLQISQYMKEF